MNCKMGFGEKLCKRQELSGFFERALWVLTTNQILAEVLNLWGDKAQITRKKN